MPTIMLTAATRLQTQLSFLVSAQAPILALGLVGTNSRLPSFILTAKQNIFLLPHEPLGVRNVVTTIEREVVLSRK